MSHTITPKKGLGKKKEGEIFRLQLFMSERGLKPQDIQRDTGVSDRTVSHSLYDEKPIGAKLLRSLHLFYGVSLDWILSGIGNMYVSDVMSSSVNENSGNYDLNERQERIMSMLDGWMADASDDQLAWLETELMIKFRQFDD